MDNLLKLNIVGPILKSVWLWRVLRLICLLLLVAMTAWGWHHHQIPGLDVRDPLMYTNITSHLFWVWWIMGVVFVALFLGRSWCAVCPLGWLNGLFSRFGFKWEMPTWLRNFIPVTLVLILLQLMVYFLAIHRFPDYTAVLLALSLFLAAGIGLLFRERAFCSLLCPAGAVFGLYARIAPFQLRVVDQDVCSGCESQRCIAEPVEWQQHRLGSTVLYRRRQLAGCPAGLVPSELADSVDCTLCLNCMQNCDKENVKLGFRKWLTDLFGTGLRPSETFFFLVLLGMLTANFSKVNVGLRDLIFWLPENAAVLLGWQQSGFYLLAVVWIALLLPLLLMLPGYLLLKLGQIQSSMVHSVPDSAPDDGQIEAPGFWVNMGRLALPFIPLVLVAHAVLALVKINAKAGYLPYALGDTSGVKSYLAMNIMQTVSAPGVLISLDVIKWPIALVLIVGLLLSYRVGYKSSYGTSSINRSYFVASLVGVTLLFSLYMSTVIEWLFVR
jgi:polyferredoxin